MLLLVCRLTLHEGRSVCLTESLHDPNPEPSYPVAVLTDQRCHAAPSEHFDDPQKAGSLVTEARPHFRDYLDCLTGEFLSAVGFQMLDLPSEVAFRFLLLS